MSVNITVISKYLNITKLCFSNTHVIRGNPRCDDCFRQKMASAADVSPNTPRADNIIGNAL